MEPGNWGFRLHRKDRLLVLGLLCLSWFGVWQDSYSLMVRWPWVMVWQGGFLAIALFLLIRLRQRSHPIQALGFGLDWAIVATIFSLVLSTLFAFRFHPSVWYLILASGYGLTFYALLNWLADPASALQDSFQVATQKRWRLFQTLGFWGFMTSSFGLGFWGAWELPEPPAPWELGFWQWVKQALTTAPNAFPLGDPHFVAGALTLILPILGVLTWGSNGRMRLFWGFATAVAGLDLYSTHAQGAIFALAGLVGVGIIRTIVQRIGQFPWAKNLRSFWRRWLLAGLSLTGLIVAVALNATVQTSVQIGFSRFLDWAINGAIVNGSQQFALQTSFRIWQDHWLFGIGLGNLVKLYGFYRPIEAGTEALQVQAIGSLRACTPLHLLAELGILGLSLYGLWCVLLARLWFQVDQALFLMSSKEQKQGHCSRDRLILNGCGAGLLAYGFMSLTDFQLENISISLTLVICMALLASLGQTYLGPVAVQIPILQRSLGWANFLLIALLLMVWVPVDRAMFSARQGMQGIEKSDIAFFYHEWSAAVKQVPWDPYYPFMMGAQLSQFIEVLKDQVLPLSLDSVLLPDNLLGLQLTDPTAPEYPNREFRENLLLAARQQLSKAVMLSPADELFNRYLGSLLVDLDPKNAIVYLRRAAKLTPRKPYTYAMMGTAYTAIDPNAPELLGAMAIEGLINPAFLLSDLWFLPELQERWVTVLKIALQTYDRCLEISATQDKAVTLLNFPFFNFSVKRPTHLENPSRNAVYQNRTLLAWWLAQLQQQPFDWQTIDLQQFSPIAKAIALLDQNRAQAALELLEDLHSDLLAPKAMLLKAWLRPDRDLDPLLKGLQDHRFSEALTNRQKDLETDLKAYLPLGSWLLSMHGNAKMTSDRIGTFSYRNTNGPNQVQLPYLLPINLLVQELSLFAEVGYLPEFDQTIVEMQKQLLFLN